METARNEPTPSETEASTSTSAAPNVEHGDKKEESFKTKTIKFFGRRTPIILQNHNGPCPLIAIGNVLSLKNSLNLSPQDPEVSKGTLINLIFEQLPASKIDDEDSSNVESQQQKISDALEFSESLTTGIYMNVRFTRIDDFERTRECAIFDLLEIPCYHGWLVDPQARETAEAIGSNSYDTLSGLVALTKEKKENELKNPKDDDAADIEEEAKRLSVLKLSEGSSCSSAADEEATEDKISIRQGSVKMLNFSRHVKYLNGEEPNTHLSIELIGNFLKDSATQLTVHGLVSLHEGMKERELCVFFRNNHFNTMFKYEGQLYILLTDEGYMNHPDLVWETLTDVNGDTQFMNENFQIAQSTDHAIARALQDEEDKKQQRRNLEQQATIESDLDWSEDDSYSFMGSSKQEGPHSDEDDASLTKQDGSCSDKSDTSSTEEEEEEESKRKICPFPWLFV